MLQRGFLMGRWYENKSPFICSTRYQLSAHKSRKKVQINKKVKDYKSLLLKRSTFFEEKDQMRSNSEETCRLLGKNAKKITIDFLLSLSSGIRIVHNNRVMYYYPHLFIALFDTF